MDEYPRLRIAGIEPESFVDGPGIRMVVFTQGCHHNCPGCQNPQTHDFNGGHFIDIEEILSMLDENPLLDGVTFSGGDPPGTRAERSHARHMAQSPRGIA